MLVTVILMVAVEATEPSTVIGCRYCYTVGKLPNGRRVFAALSVTPPHAEMCSNILPFFFHDSFLTGIGAEAMYILAVVGVLESLPAMFSAFMWDSRVKVIMIVVSTAMLPASDSFSIFTKDKMVASVMTHDGETGILIIALSFACLDTRVVALFTAHAALTSLLVVCDDVSTYFTHLIVS